MNIVKNIFKMIRGLIAFPFQLVGQLILILGLIVLGIGETIINYYKFAKFITEFKKQLDKTMED